jgi:hypothetical protein
MDCNKQITTRVDIDESVVRSKAYLLCKVCGIEGAQIHYGGICCVSCKMFFRRNAHYDLVS